MALIALSDSFEYLCYGSMAIRNIFTLTVRGLTLSDVRFCRLKSSPALSGLSARHDYSCF